MVGNLTTVSSSVRDFTTLLLGYHFAERVAEAAGPGTELDTFLKWEQLAAYARAHVNKDLSFRGVDRVRRALGEGSRVTLSADRAHHILGDQRIYGLWGLYTAPARASGLVDADPPRLTQAARELVASVYLPALSSAGFRDGEAIARRLREPTVHIDLEGRAAALIEAVARLLRRRILASERPFYHHHLVEGGPQDRTHGLQRELARLFSAPPFNAPTFAFTPAAVRQLARAGARAAERGDELSRRLERIGTCETLMAPASALFSFLLARNGDAISETAAAVRGCWGARVASIDVEALESLQAELSDASGGAESGQRWIRLGAALAGGDYEDAVRQLLRQNRQVMASRGGAAPWVDEREGRLDVSFRDEDSELPPRDELGELWRFPYFLGSLRAVALALKEG